MNMKLSFRIKLAYSLIVHPDQFYEFMVLQRLAATEDLRRRLNRERRRKLAKIGKAKAK